MKVHQFLSKFLHASSSIKHVYIRAYTERKEVELSLGEVVDPQRKDNSHREHLETTLVGFQVRNDSLYIYSK